MLLPSIWQFNLCIYDYSYIYEVTILPARLFAGIPSILLFLGMDQEDYFNQTKKDQKEQQKRREQEEEQRRQKKLEEERQTQQKKIQNDGKIDDDLSEKPPVDEKRIDLEVRGSKKSSKTEISKKIKGSHPVSKQTELLKPAELVEREIGKNYFIVPDSVPAEINKALLEKEDNLVRRWKVLINEIRLENLQKEQLSVFLNFKIGQVGKNANKYEDVSSQEVYFKSEICKDLKRSESKVIKVMFQSEMHLSYQMLKERYFVIEVWEYRRFRLNLFLGKIQVSLLSIATGNIRRQDEIKKAFGERRQFARIYYNILFQEVWDYKLTFEAWKASNIVADEGKSYDPKVELQLCSNNLIWPSVKSESIKQTKNPNFKNLKGSMHFRGTMEDLTQQMMMVILYKDEYFELTRKLASLRGIQDTNYLKVQFRLKLKKPPPRPKQVTQKKTKKTKTARQKLEEDGEDDDSEDEDALRDEAYIAIVEGRINLNKQPRYGQNGELNMYIPNQYYLVITINRLNNVLSPDDRGVINTYLTVAWRDQAKTTRVIKNDPNPTYNEELYFHIPILMRELTLEDIISQKTEKDLIIDALREELKSRPDITIQLWLDGMDILSDESLGYCRVFLSEIQNAQKFKKTLLTDDNKKFLYETREATFTRKFESGLFNVNHIQITFQCFFAPDLPEELDLGEFCEIPDEIYPYQISDQLRVGNDHEENLEYKAWDADIRRNFSQIGLEKTAYNIFFKNIFVRDQFNYYHLICKYLEKFYVRYQNQEATKELFADPSDIRIKGVHEMCHFVRNIPFIQDSFSRSDVWRSPDFLLKVRKGFIHDHAILAACLLMGLEFKDKKYEKRIKNYVPLEHRVFVCLGTLKHNHAFHAWIMVYSHDLADVHLWDVQEDFNAELVGRVKSTQRGDLRRFLFAEKPQQKKENKRGDKKLSRRELMRLEKEKLAQEKLEKKRQIEKMQREQELLAQKEEEDKLIQARYGARFQEDDVENQEEQTVGLEDMKMMGGTVKVKNWRQMGMTEANYRGTATMGPQTTIFNSKSMKQTVDAKDGERTTKDDRKTTKQMFSNPFFSKFRGEDEKVSAIQQREQAEEELRKKNPIAKFTKVEAFLDAQKQPVEDTKKLPYATVEIIFNNKNIWGNLGNQNPQEIFYHLHKKSEWLPFINETVMDEKEEEYDGDSGEEFSELDENEVLQDMETADGLKKVPWRRAVGSFYSAQILKEPIKKNRIKLLLEDIFMEIRQGVEKARGKFGLFTKWKVDRDRINVKLEQYLKILEYQATNRAIRIVQLKKDDAAEGDAAEGPLKSKRKVKWNEEYPSKDYQYIIDQWKKEVKSNLPLNCHLCILPMRFNFTQSEKIRSVIVENMGAFFMRKESKIIFNLAGKIFNYPNKIVCVRLALGYTYSQTIDELEQREEEEDEQEQQIQVDTEKPLLDNLEDEDDEKGELLKNKEKQPNGENE